MFGVDLPTYVIRILGIFSVINIFLCAFMICVIIILRVNKLAMKYGTVNQEKQKNGNTYIRMHALTGFCSELHGVCLDSCYLYDK